MKSRIKWLIGKLGYDIRKSDLTDPARGFMSLLSLHRIDLIVDIGANDGAYIERLRRKSGYAGHVISFEPLPDAYQTLRRRASTDIDWIVADRCAIGDSDGVVRINVAGNSESSSIRPMLDSHVEAAPKSTYVGSHEVPVKTLDGALSGFAVGDRRTLLKIDTQGYESQVLDGAANTLRAVRGIHLELSLTPLYEGQTLYLDLIARLESLGFKLWLVAPMFWELRSGRLLQFDATFFRPLGTT